MKLSAIPKWGKAKIKEINHPLLRTKLLEMGVVPGVEITLMMRAPFQGPIAFQCGNTNISVRSEDADFIIVN
ncbi:MAG: ferrous iron transport protein A [Flavobacteriia bacterium]|jgi:ferrous iron transport protein A|nr:ferrous iron transport protein A [Flavobacteriia bacterium]